MTRRRSTIVVAAGVVVTAVAVIVAMIAGRSAQQSQVVGVDSAPLRAAITVDRLTAHLDALQRIAEDNGGNRAAGMPGYAASVDYVETALRRAGYTTQRQQFSYQRPDFTRASLRRDAPTSTEYVVGRDHRPMALSGTGSVTAAVTAVDINLDGDRATTSGCEESDFASFPRGNIALVQRGTCPFDQKVGFAASAGAAAVVVFNQGNGGDDSRLGLFAGTLAQERPVPVVATTFGLGQEWSGPGTVLSLTVEATSATVTTENLIADPPAAARSSERTLVVGAHLDSVAEGPGMNDNASGVAAVLEIALGFAELGVQTAKPVRFVFWGGEEDGLHGARYYVDQLDEAQRRAVSGYLNLDMIGSPNPTVAVYGQAGWPAGSAAMQGVLTDYLSGAGTVPQVVGFRSSDHAPFLDAGIPVGGLFTGADSRADPCYHQACDRADGLDKAVLELIADAAAHATLTFAQA